MLSIHKLSYHINQLQILHEIEGFIKPGEIVALVGPNGAGKSTLADIICGFRKPSSGRVLIAEKEVTGLKPHVIAQLGIARMFQGAYLAWNLTAEENVLIGLPEVARSDGGQKKRIELAMALLERVGLLDQRKEIARRLSFGQQRLLALARVLARPAKVLILDEPFSGLKGPALGLITDIVSQEANFGKSVLIIDHLLSALRDLRCRFWYLAKGKLSTFPSFGVLASSDLFRSGYGASPKKSNMRTDQFGDLANSDALHPTLDIIEATLGYNNRVILRGVSLSAHGHESIGLVGLNGIGKSTLLKAIIGTCKFFTGNVYLDKRDMTSLPVHERIRSGVRLLPQDHRLFRTLSVLANRKLAQSGLGGRLASEGISHLRSDFGDRAAGTLSGGEQARVALELLDIGNCSLILLDEPTTGIDNATKEWIYSNLLSWQKAGKITIFVEHDFEFVVHAASRAYVLTVDRLIDAGISEIYTGRDLLEKVLTTSISIGGS